MMLSTAAAKSTALSDTQKSTQSFLFRKIWLPKLLYALLPYFYLASGLVAFLATIYIIEWFWVLPLYLLFSAACVHLGVIVYRRRNRDEA
jgi:fatty acid desaturase